MKRRPLRDGIKEEIVDLEFQARYWEKGVDIRTMGPTPKRGMEAIEIVDVYRSTPEDKPKNLVMTLRRKVVYSCP